MSKSSETIFTFQNCRYWLRFPGITGKALTRKINQLQADRAGEYTAITKPLQAENGEQTELAVVDVFASGNGYEYKLDNIIVSEDSVFF